MYGCKYCKMDKENNERCSLTGELTNNAVMCDFEWEFCPEFQNALKPIHPPRSDKPELIQTSVFGAAGEKPFEG